MLIIIEIMENQGLLPKSQVRWFHRDVKSKQWLPFGGSDSLDLETAYQTSQSEAPSLQLGVCNSPINPGYKPSSTNVNNSGSLVSVFDGLYEVDLQTLTYQPVYWKDPKHFPVPVLRGNWFRVNSKGLRVPIEDHSMSEKLEETYSGLCISSTSSGSTTDLNQDEAKHGLPVTFSSPSFGENLQYSDTDSLTTTQDLGTTRSSSFTQSTKIFPKIPKRKSKKPILTKNFDDCHVDFYSLENIYLYEDTTSLYIRQKLGMRKVGSRLYRGYGVEAVDNDRGPPITHLCFVVHGIGQKIGLRPILKSVNAFREVCKQNKSKYFTDPIYTNQRVEFLPVEWRCSLQLACNTIDSITPLNIRRVRHTLNSSAMDIMYYTSPLYRTEITTSLAKKLNLMYSKFCQRNPNFESTGGKVSIIAHSLGCVLMYDLITGWNTPSFEYPTDNAGSELGNEQVNSPTNNPQSPESFTYSISQMLPTDVLQNLVRLSTQLETVRSQADCIESKISHLLNSNTNGTPTKRASFTCGSVLLRPSATSLVESKCSLLFESRLKNLFCLGSPLGVYLVLRGIRPGAYVTQDTILPRSICPRLFNIYHPSDPVAYRLEPLLLQHYASVEPVVLRAAGESKNFDYDGLPLVPISVDDQGRGNEQQPDSNEQVMEHFAIPEQSILSSDGRSYSDEQIYHSTESECTLPKGRLHQEFSPSIQTSPPHGPTERPYLITQLESYLTRPYSELLLDADLFMDQMRDDFTPHSFDSAGKLSRLQLEHRIDYQLRTARYGHSYLSVFTSHVGYWVNADMSMLILTHSFNSQESIG